MPPPWKHTLGLNRVRQRHLNIYAGYRKKFSSPGGIAAVKHGFNDKTNSGDDDELTVYGLNSGTGEIFYNTSMVSVGFFGRQDEGAGDLHGTVGVAADREGNVFVTDGGGHRLIRLQNRENRLRFVSATARLCGAPLRSPAGIAMEGGRVFVADSGNNRLIEMALDGTTCREIRSSVELVQPFGVDVILDDNWNFYGSRFIVVSDSLNQRLLKLDMDGAVLGARRIGEISGQEGSLDFVAIDYYSNVYVTDRRQGCIYKFDRYLRYLTRIGCGSGSDDDLVEPRGIAIYRRFGQVFVSEAIGASYFWVGTDVENLRCTYAVSEKQLLLDTRFVLTEQSSVSVHLISEDGSIVKTLSDQTFVPPGYVHETYTVRSDELPCPLANCTLRLAVEARATYSSRKYHSVRRETPLRHL